MLCIKALWWHFHGLPPAQLRGLLRRSDRLWGLWVALILTSCGVKVVAPVPGEFAAGLSYTNYFLPKAPWSIHVVRAARSRSDLELHTTHARGCAIGLSTLSEQIKGLKPQLGTPLAGINGDFYVRDRAYIGDPRGLQVMEGELISAPVGNGSFWIDGEGQPHVAIVSSLFKVTWPNGTNTQVGLNEERTPGTPLVLYTPAIGRSTRTSNGIELVLERGAESPWLPLRVGTTYTARVREVRESANTALTPQTMVLSISPTLRSSLPQIDAGAVLKLSTETSPPLRDVRTAIGGGPVLVHEGHRQPLQPPVGEGLNFYVVRSMKERHPRTALGWDDQYFYMFEVDGRQRGLSMGMTLNEVADFMIQMGCTEVLNLDGGGSAMFWCNGRIVNSPCDRRERDIANALILVRKPTASASSVGSDLKTEDRGQTVRRAQ